MIDICVAALAGLVVGSFLNVVIYRLPVMMDRTFRRDAAGFLREALPESSHPSFDAMVEPILAPTRERFNLVLPRSRCPKCQTPIPAWRNIPVLSWLLQRGRCAACQAPISIRYPIVELTCAIASAVAVATFGWTALALAASGLSWVLIALALIDADTTLLPDDLTLPLLWIGILLNVNGLFASLPDSVIGAAAGYLALWGVYWIFKLLTGKEGMGYGDFKLLAALGAWFGWQALPAIVLLSSVVGSVVGIALIVTGAHRKGMQIPFGPYLAGAGLLTLYFGQPLMALYSLH